MPTKKLLLGILAPVFCLALSDITLAQEDLDCWLAGGRTSKQLHDCGNQLAQKGKWKEATKCFWKAYHDPAVKGKRPASLCNDLTYGLYKTGEYEKVYPEGCVAAAKDRKLLAAAYYNMGLIYQHRSRVKYPFQHATTAFVLSWLHRKTRMARDKWMQLLEHGLPVGDIWHYDQNGLSTSKWVKANYSQTDLPCCTQRDKLPYPMGCPFETVIKNENGITRTGWLVPTINQTFLILERWKNGYYPIAVDWWSSNSPSFPKLLVVTMEYNDYGNKTGSLNRIQRFFRPDKLNNSHYKRFRSLIEPMVYFEIDWGAGGRVSRKIELINQHMVISTKTKKTSQELNLQAHPDYKLVPNGEIPLAWLLFGQMEMDQLPTTVKAQVSAEHGKLSDAYAVDLNYDERIDWLVRTSISCITVIDGAKNQIIGVTEGGELSQIPYHLVNGYRPIETILGYGREATLARCHVFKGKKYKRTNQECER